MFCGEFASNPYRDIYYAGGALHMIDIREPKAPKFAGCYGDPKTGNQGTGGTHDSQCVVYRGPDGQYQGREICFNASETALGIADVTDKAAPKALSRASHPNNAYTHQGWLSDDQKYFFVNDEGDEVDLLIKEVKGDIVVIDFNHPFAGKTLHFDVTVREIRPATKEELAHGHAHGPGSDH